LHEVFTGEDSEVIRWGSGRLCPREVEEEQERAHLLVLDLLPPTVTFSTEEWAWWWDLLPIPFLLWIFSYSHSCI